MALSMSARLPERVAEAIRTKILHGQLRPGERLTESQVVGWLNVSNIPVREAFYLLEQEGLLVREPRRGTYVRKLDTEHVRDLYMIRAALEEIACRLLIEKDALQPSDYADLEKCIQEQVEAAAADDVVRLVELDLQFHDLLYDRTGSGVLIDLWGTIRARIRLLIYWRSMYITDPERRHAPSQLHRRILHYLRERDLQQLIEDNRKRHEDSSTEMMRLLAESGQYDSTKAAQV